MPKIMFKLHFLAPKAVVPAKPIALETIEEPENPTEEAEELTMEDFQAAIEAAFVAALKPLQSEVASLRNQVEAYRTALSTTAAPSTALPQPTQQLPSAPSGPVDEFTARAQEKRRK